MGGVFKASKGNKGPRQKWPLFLGGTPRCAGRRVTRAAGHLRPHVAMTKRRPMTRWCALARLAAIPNACLAPRGSAWGRQAGAPAPVCLLRPARRWTVPPVTAAHNVLRFAPPLPRIHDSCPHPHRAHRQPSAPHNPRNVQARLPSYSAKYPRRVSPGAAPHTTYALRMQHISPSPFPASGLPRKLSPPS